MTLARASSIKGVKDDPRTRWLLRMRDPDYVPPRYQPIQKEPGSKKLVCGEWITVKDDDTDAEPATTKASSRGGSSAKKARAESRLQR